jgi:hypothetical protein
MSFLTYLGGIGLAAVLALAFGFLYSRFEKSRQHSSARNPLFSGDVVPRVVRGVE